MSLVLEAGGDSAERECPRSSTSEHLLSPAPLAPARHLLALTRLSATPCWVLVSNTAVGQMRLSQGWAGGGGSREQSLLPIPLLSAYGFRVFLPDCNPFPSTDAWSAVQDSLCPPQELLGVCFSVVFIVVVVGIINISDSCLLWFLHGWFWETESAAHPILPYRYHWVFFKRLFFVP